MPVVRLSQKIQISQYEPMEFSVELTEVDVPKEEGETTSQHVNRLHRKAYGQVLGFELLHGKINQAQVVSRMSKFNKLYKIENNDN